MINKEKPNEEVGNVYISLTTKQTPFKSITLSNILVSFTEGADLLGESEPYVIARIGGWAARTEVGDANRYTFKKNLELKYSVEE